MSAALDQRRDTRLVCHCRKVPYAAVENAVQSGQASTLFEVQRETTACTRCFGCRFEIENLLEEHLGERYQRSGFVSLPTDSAPSGVRGRLRRLLRRTPQVLPKRMYMPLLDGFHGDVRTRVVLFHWHEDGMPPPEPVALRADVLALDGSRLAVWETRVPPRCSGILDVRALLDEERTALPGGIGILKIVLDAERVASLRPYFQLITPTGVTSTHEKASPKAGRISKQRHYHWVFPVGYADRPASAYFFATNTLVDPLCDQELVWRNEAGDETRMVLPDLELDQSVCVALHEHAPAIGEGREAGSVRLEPASHVAGFIIWHDSDGDSWRVQHL